MKGIKFSVFESKRTKIILSAMLIVLIGGVIFFMRGPTKIKQPVRFNHKKHVQDNGLTCDFCHKFYETQTFAGIPNIETCSMCHTEDVSDSPEAKKVKGYVERQEQIPWIQMYKVRSHVRFSHRLHVAKEVKCEECHGETGISAVPTRYRNFGRIDKTMNFCIECHKNRGASTDCNACHK